MPISEDAITQVIGEIAGRLQDGEFVTQQVDALRTAQPAVVQYVVAHQSSLSMQSIVQVLFQVVMIGRMVAVANGRPPTTLGYNQLDVAARTTPDLEKLAEVEPDLASFIFSNIDVEGPDGAGPEEAKQVAGKVLAQVARAMVDA